MAEAPGLGPVPVYRDRLSSESLVDEPWYDHAVGGALAGPDRVEETYDDRRQVTFPVVRVGKDLVDGLGSRVRPTGDRRRPEDAVRLFVERARVVLPVDLRGARDHHLAPVAVGRFQHRDRALDVGRQGVQGLFDDELDAYGGCEVHDDVTVPDCVVDDQLVEHRALDEAEVRMVRESRPGLQRRPVERLSRARDFVAA